MKDLWNWLSGKKSVIGGILALTIGFLGTKQIIDSDTATYLLGLAALFLGVGLGHKVVKAKQ